MQRRGISLAYSDLNQKPALAQQAEAAGFATVWNSGESIPVFGAMSMTTSKAQIGSGVIRAFAHSERNLAQYAADLQQLSNGRFILGLGGGTKRMNINQLGKEFDHPATRLRELIKLMRVLWNTPGNQAVDFQGTYYQLAGTGLGGHGYNGAMGGDTPIYLAAVNKAMFRLAGELCQGLCGHPIASVRFIEETAWPSIDEGLKRGGKTRADFDHCAWLVTAISNDRKQALRELKYHVGRFMATRSYAIVLDSQGLEKVRLEIQDAFFSSNDDIDAVVAAVPDDVAYAHGLAGTPDDVREQLKKYDGLGVTPTFYSASFGMSKDRTKENINAMISTFAQ